MKYEVRERNDRELPFAVVHPDDGIVAAFRDRDQAEMSAYEFTVADPAWIQQQGTAMGRA
jgi:hypothetical protein